MNNLVKPLRIKRKMTQNELAWCCGVSRQTIIAIEKGIFNPSLSLAYKLAKVLNYKMEDMYDFSPLDKEIRQLEEEVSDDDLTNYFKKNENENKERD